MTLPNTTPKAYLDTVNKAALEECPGVRAKY